MCSNDDVDVGVGDCGEGDGDDGGDNNDEHYAGGKDNRVVILMHGGGIDLNNTGSRIQYILPIKF